jgi:hypothetical protein
MSHHKTMELYNQIGTQEKRAVNRLLKAFASGNVERQELQSICRSISRNTSASQDAGPKRVSPYILYYKERYADLRENMPAASLGEIAKVVGKEWKALGQAKQAEYHKQARNAAS